MTNEENETTPVVPDGKVGVIHPQQVYTEAEVQKLFAKAEKHANDQDAEIKRLKKEIIKANDYADAYKGNISKLNTAHAEEIKRLNHLAEKDRIAYQARIKELKTQLETQNQEPGTLIINEADYSIKAMIHAFQRRYEAGKSKTFAHFISQLYSDMKEIAPKKELL